MAEVDQLILLQLKGIGVNVDNVQNVAGFDSALFYTSAYKCCELISRDLVKGMLETLPTGKSQMFKATSNMASAVSNAGYTDEITFNLFMYPIAGDVRKVLSWLCQNLPNKEDGGRITETGPGDADIISSAWEVLETKARAFEKRQAARKQAVRYIWPPLKGEYPGALKKTRALPATIHPFATPTSEAEADWCSANLPFTSRQVYDLHDLYTSIIAHNGAAVAKEKQDELEWESAGKASGLSRKEFRRQKREQMQQKMASASASTSRYKGKNSLLGSKAEEVEVVKSTKSRFMKEKEFGTEAVTNELGLTAQEESALAQAESQHELKKQQKKAEEKAVRAQLKEVSASIAQMGEEAAAAERELERLAQSQESGAERVKDLVEDGDALEDMFNVYQTALELCNDADGSTKLQERMEAAQQEHEAVQAEWAAKEKKLKSKYDAFKAELESANIHLTTLTEEIESAKARIKELKLEARKKEEMKKGLEVDLENCPKDVNREYYLERIMDIIKNIMKQQDEVEKITEQSRETIREIAGMNEGLATAFTVAEEKCYNEVKQDASNQYGKAVYRQLIALREAFDALIEDVESQGRTKQSIYEYEEKIDRLKNRNEGLNTAEVAADLESVRGENEKAAANLKELRAKLKALSK